VIWCNATALASVKRPGDSANRSKEAAVKRIALGLVILLALGSHLSAGQTLTVEAALIPASARTLAPDFTLEDGTGKAIRLSGYRGNVVLLDFWATKCGGCVEEIPMFIQVVDAFRAKGLRALGVAEDIIYEDLPGATEAWNLVKPFVRDHDVNYPVVVDNTGIYRRYNITALPLTYLLDVNGRIAATYLGVVNRSSLERNIATLLAESGSRTRE
jgi:peroxiredoxin